MPPAGCEMGCEPIERRLPSVRRAAVDRSRNALRQPRGPPALAGSASQRVDQPIQERHLSIPGDQTPAGSSALSGSPSPSRARSRAASPGPGRRRRREPRRGTGGRDRQSWRRPRPSQEPRTNGLSGPPPPDPATVRTTRPATASAAHGAPRPRSLDRGVQERSARPLSCFLLADLRERMANRGALHAWPRAASSFAILSSRVPIASSWALRWAWICWASWNVASASW